jgi:hypothetical protein
VNFLARRRHVPPRWFSLRMVLFKKWKEPFGGKKVRFHRKVCLPWGIIVTYSQFDSNIHVFYVFWGFLKNT